MRNRGNMAYEWEADMKRQMEALASSDARFWLPDGFRFLGFVVEECATGGAALIRVSEVDPGSINDMLAWNDVVGDALRALDAASIYR